MINTIEKITDKKKNNIDFSFDNLCTLPNWETINEIAVSKRTLFGYKIVNFQLCRKFSPKNIIEKYSLRLNEVDTIAYMDLRVYKDCVYIINLESDSKNLFKETLVSLLQVAFEKAVLETTNKEIKINLSYPLIKKNKIKKVLKNIGFKEEADQSKYEKSIFGELLCAKVEISDLWNNKIKQTIF